MNNIKSLVDVLFFVDENMIFVATPANGDSSYELPFMKGAQDLPLIEQTKRRNAMSIFFKDLMKKGGGGVTVTICKEDKTLDVFGYDINKKGKYTGLTGEQVKASIKTNSDLPFPINYKDWNKMVEYLPYWKEE